MHTAYAACPYLDQEAVMQMWTDDTDFSKEEILERLEQDYKREVMSPRELMGVAEENAYMTFFVDPALRTDLMERADRIKEVFREMLSNEEWLSDAGKKAAIEKLDNMHFQILRPDTLIDTSYLSVDLSASFLENYAGLRSRTLKHEGSFAGRRRDPAEWQYDLRPEIATTVANAFYYGTFNQFFILDGFIPEDLYCLDMSEEEKLAGIGEIIGHELTHGFDPDGIKFDKDGNMVQTRDNPYGWMTKEDHEAFQKRAAKLADYFDDIIPFPYSACSGETVKGEAAADIAGMSICLKIAGNIEDFDYDLFFRKHALLWMKQDSLVNERGDITDAHPLPHLRINTTVQQFDEFLDTYGVEEGDGMYLAPKERVVIW